MITKTPMVVIFNLQKNLSIYLKEILFNVHGSVMDPNGTFLAINEMILK